MNRNQSEERDQQEERPGAGYNLRPRTKLLDADDEVRLINNKVLTVVHAPEILKKSTNRPRTEWIVIREDATEGSNQAGPAKEEEIGEDQQKK